MNARILLVDDHGVFRSGLKALLEREADLDIVAEAGDGPEALTLLDSCAADVVILDLGLPGSPSGSPLIQAMLKMKPRLRIVVLTMHDDEYYLREVFKFGVKAYVLKQSSAADVVQAIRTVMKGGRHIDPSLAGLAVSSLIVPAYPTGGTRKDVLTQREKEVCRLLALGHTNAETADLLEISARTVETHRNNIMAKLDLKNRAELVRYALDNELIK